jgi:hypothetical protein
VTVYVLTMYLANSAWQGYVPFADQRYHPSTYRTRIIPFDNRHTEFGTFQVRPASTLNLISLSMSLEPRFTVTSPW